MLDLQRSKGQMRRIAPKMRPMYKAQSGMNFSDATSSTQGRYANVTTAGSTVWDPSVQEEQSEDLPARRWDDLPAFATLTSDEERERKAETQRPGTFGVVATPESFSTLPEYAPSASLAGRRPSVQSSTHSSIGSPASSSGRSQPRLDPNVVVLDRFEEGSTAPPMSYPLTVPSRRPSMPEEAIRNLTITAPAHVASPAFNPVPYTRIPSSDDHLTVHFRRTIIRRLTQPATEGQVQPGLVPGSTRDVFELEAARYRPLHHAICALSALNLSYNGRASLEEALQHYQSALSVASPATADDLLSDGVFLRHFLLFIYDIAVPMEADHGGDMMWAQHLNHLRSIALQRHHRLGRERHGYVLWSICELDLQACLLGSGNCDFANTVLEHGMLPSLDAQIPAVGMAGPYHQSEANVFPIIQRLNETVVLNAIKVAQQARQGRGTNSHPSPGVQARLQANISRLQHELITGWARSYPDFLGPESPQAGYNLPPRARYVFEHAFLLHQASMIYSRTSMFATQRSIPVANQGEIHADTERRCIGILTLADTYADNEIMLEHRHAVFPVFMAGVATTQPDAKIQAINIIKAMERGAIGQNTYRTRQLLIAVCEEQRRVTSASGRMENVDWLTVARERGLSVVNCGL